MRYAGMPRPRAKAKEKSLDTGRDPNRISRVEKTYKELIAQPEAFSNTIHYTDEVKEKFTDDLLHRKIRRVVLIGCGDSWFVGTCLEVLIEKLLACPCQSYDAFEFYTSHYSVANENTLLIGQSASGTTKAVIGSIKRAKERGSYTVGISNTPDAEILTIADFGLLVQASREGWPTQATISAIGAIAQLFASLCLARGENVSYADNVIRELFLLPLKIRKAIDDNEEIISKSASLFDRTLFFQAAGSGCLYGASMIAAAKLKELCPVHASSYPLEEFHHYRSLKPADPLILFVQGGDIQQKEEDTALVGAYDGGVIIVIGNSITDEMHKVTDLFFIVPETLRELQSIVSVIPAHLFAYYVAKSKFEADIGYPSMEQL